MIYLDNSATTYPKPECVYEALDYANRNLAFNAGRGHYPKSSKAQNVINEARNIIASFIRVDSNRVVFSSSATESLNQIIYGLDLQPGDNVYVSPFEHNAVIRPLYGIKGINIITIPFDKKTWQLSENEFDNMLALNKPKAIIISHVSNTTGLVLPYEEIFKKGKNYNSINVLDCAQSYGVLNPNIENINYLVFAAHKSLYSTFGIGGFIQIKEDCLLSVKKGGTGSDSLNKNMPEQAPDKFEAGSANVVALNALCAGANWTKNQKIASHEYELTNYFIRKLKELDNIILFLPDNVQPLGIVSFAVEGYDSNDIADILSEEYDICVRAGYHCAPLVHDFIGSKKYNGTIRVSIGAFNDEDDIDGIVSALSTF